MEEDEAYAYCALVVRAQVKMEAELEVVQPQFSDAQAAFGRCGSDWQLAGG